MKKIAILPGDGIGPEVIAQALRILEYYRDERKISLSISHFDLGADRYLRDGTTLPVELFRRIESETDAILLGALGDPRIPKSKHAHEILFGLRFGLDLYANVRPVRALSDRLVPLKGRSARDVQFTVFRENTEGIYAGVGGQFKRLSDDEIGINEDINTRKGVERLIRAGFEFAAREKRTVVHLADKSNAMRYAHELWHRTFFEVAREYSGICAKHMYVDALAHALVMDPSQFQVIVTCNLFGDILTDLAAALQGGLGMAASASLNPIMHRVGLFEPVHGSAPLLAGTNRANPMASILTVGMLLSHLGYPDEESRLEEIIAKAIAERMCTEDVGGKLGTVAVGDWIVDQLRQ